MGKEGHKRLIFPHQLVTSHLFGNRLPGWAVIPVEGFRRLLPKEVFVAGNIWKRSFKKGKSCSQCLFWSQGVGRSEDSFSGLLIPAERGMGWHFHHKSCPAPRASCTVWCWEQSLGLEPQKLRFKSLLGPCLASVSPPDLHPQHCCENTKNKTPYLLPNDPRDTNGSIYQCKQTRAITGWDLNLNVSLGEPLFDLSHSSGEIKICTDISLSLLVSLPEARSTPCLSRPQKMPLSGGDCSSWVHLFSSGWPHESLRTGCPVGNSSRPLCHALFSELGSVLEWPELYRYQLLNSHLHHFGWSCAISHLPPHSYSSHCWKLCDSLHLLVNLHLDKLHWKYGGK